MERKISFSSAISQARGEHRPYLFGRSFKARTLAFSREKTRERQLCSVAPGLTGSSRGMRRTRGKEVTHRVPGRQRCCGASVGLLPGWFWRRSHTVFLSRCVEVSYV
ncbi:hypothetical protein CSUI_003645 [Cystoisospora suis]|uniref:Uncharacterized protein n=1 Tax=Cystoisospora suis TaxID=483139 RepID=A0A2C6L4M9_9APIC|nr:hypothetical protein CSUI_003645 [Cystoisospora suis]